MSGRHIKIFDTAEARAQGKKYEWMHVLEENAAGVIASKGKYITIFLPWGYLARHGYQYKD